MEPINQTAAAMIARCGITPKGDFTLDGMKASVAEIVEATNRQNPPRLLVRRNVSVAVAKMEGKLRLLQSEIAGAWHCPEGRQRIAFDGENVVTAEDLQRAGATVYDSSGLLVSILSGALSVLSALDAARTMKLQREERDRNREGTLWCLQGNEEWQNMNGKGIPCRHVAGTWEERNIRDVRRIEANK